MKISIEIRHLAALIEIADAFVDDMGHDNTYTQKQTHEAIDAANDAIREQTMKRD
jgi:hypothetical protein